MYYESKVQDVIKNPELRSKQALIMSYPFRMSQRPPRQFLPDESDSFSHNIPIMFVSQSPDSLLRTVPAAGKGRLARHSGVLVRHAGGYFGDEPMNELDVLRGDIPNRHGEWFGTVQDW